MKRASSRHRSNRAVFVKPAIVALATLVGLAAGLLGDGIYDGLAWLGLGIPIAIIVAVVVRSRSTLPVRRAK